MVVLTVFLLFPSLMQRGNTEKQETQGKKYNDSLQHLLPIKGYLKSINIQSFKRF